MTVATLASQGPALAGSKMLTFTHQCDEGFNVYAIVVPADYEAPEGTMGGEELVEDHPETWAKYKRFVDLLEIPFDETDSEHFLWCHEDPLSDIKIASADDLS